MQLPEGITIDSISEKLNELVLNYAPRLAGAVVVLIVGHWVIRLLVNALGKSLDHTDGMEASLKPFLLSLSRNILRVLLYISVLGMLGVEMTSFIAILGAVGLAIGMALSGTLQNFAGGVMILLFKPFKVGDVISAQGYTGSVLEIQIFNTILRTPQLQHIILPNGPLSNTEITNYNKEPNRRADVAIGIDYGADIGKAKDALLAAMKADERVLKEPAPFVVVTALGGSSIDLSARCYTTNEHYWDVLSDMHAKCKTAMDDAGINIPFPQMDVHLDGGLKS